MSLNRAGAWVLGGAVVLGLAGIAVDSPAILAGAFVYLAALALSTSTLRRAAVERTTSLRRVGRGSPLAIDVAVRLPKGFGDVEIEQPLPEDAVVLSGSNVTVGRRGAETHLRMVVRFPECGRHVLPAVRLVYRDPLGLRDPILEDAGEATPIDVLPRFRAAKVKGRHARARTFGHGTGRALVGVEGDDIIGVRPYSVGDSPRRVNWKATARYMARNAEESLLVNEPDRRGRRLIWVVVDADPLLVAPSPAGEGRLLDDALEAAARIATEAASGGDMVGLLAPGVLLAPGGGRRFEQRALEALAAATVGDLPPLPPPRSLRNATVVVLTRLPFRRPEVEDFVHAARVEGARVDVILLRRETSIPEEMEEEAQAAIAAVGGRPLRWSPDTVLEVRV